MLGGRSWLRAPRRRPAAGRKECRGAQGMAEGWLWPAASLRRMCGGGWKVRLKGAPQCSPSTELRVTAAGPPDSHSYNWEDSPAPSRGCWRAVGEMDGWKRPSARHRFIIIISSACYIPMLLLLIKRAKSLAHRARRTNTYMHKPGPVTEHFPDVHSALLLLVNFHARHMIKLLAAFSLKF